jgi:hypothetical protein
MELVVLRGGRVTGRVVGPGGEPVAGAEVRSRRGVHTTSREDGTFLLEGLDEPEQAQVWARSADRALSGESAAFVAGAGKDAEGIEVRLASAESSSRRRRVVITGKATADDPGAAAAAGSLRDAHVECAGAWTPLDPSGEFHVEAEVSAASVQIGLRIVLPGWGAAELALDAASDAESVAAGDVEIQRSNSLNGVVEGPDGPLPGVRVALAVHRGGTIGCGFDEDEQALVVAVTKGDGTFIAHGVPVGKFDVKIEEPGFLPAEQDVEIDGRGDAEVSFRLVRESVLRGRLVRRDGRPVPEAQIRVQPEGEQGWSARSKFAGTEDDGSFAIPVEHGAAYVLHCAPGRTYMPPGLNDESPEETRARDAAGRFLPFRSEPLQPGGEPAILVVEDGAAISGRVVDADGRPAGGVHMSCGGDRADVAPDGTFSFAGLREGTYVLTAAHGLADPLVLEGVETGSTDLVLRLPPPAVIEGTPLGEDGTPVAHRGLVATRMGTDRGASVFAETDDAGRFRFVDVGDVPCRIELGSARRSWMRTTRSRSPAAPGSRRGRSNCSFGSCRAARGRSPGASWTIEASPSSTTSSVSRSART